jgi:ABC-type uncharacterized transport system auxiliary subunit
MRFLRMKSLAIATLIAILACPVLMTGCRTQNTTVYNQHEPPDYRQWEHDTNRLHVDIDKRSADEQKEYRDWHDAHNPH